MTDTEQALRDIITRHIIRSYEAGYQAALAKARNIITIDIEHTDIARLESELAGDADAVSRLGLMSDYLSFMRLSICGPAEQEEAAMFQFKEQRAPCGLPCGWDCNHPEGCLMSPVDVLAAALKKADPERDEDWDYRPYAEAVIATGIFGPIK